MRRMISSPVIKICQIYVNKGYIDIFSQQFEANETKNFSLKPIKNRELELFALTSFHNRQYVACKRLFTTKKESLCTTSLPCASSSNQPVWDIHLAFPTSIKSGNLNV